MGIVRHQKKKKKKGKGKEKPAGLDIPYDIMSEIQNCKDDNPFLANCKINFVLYIP